MFYQKLTCILLMCLQNFTAFSTKVRTICPLELSETFKIFLLFLLFFRNDSNQSDRGAILGSIVYRNYQLTKQSPSQFINSIQFGPVVFIHILFTHIQVIPQVLNLWLVFGISGPFGNIHDNVSVLQTQIFQVVQKNVVLSG